MSEDVARCRNKVYNENAHFATLPIHWEHSRIQSLNPCRAAPDAGLDHEESGFTRGRIFELTLSADEGMPASENSRPHQEWSYLSGRGDGQGGDGPVVARRES